MNEILGRVSHLFNQLYSLILALVFANYSLWCCKLIKVIMPFVERVSYGTLRCVKLRPIFLAIFFVRVILTHLMH